MKTTQALSITLPVEMAEMVKAKVLSGEYANESDVIYDGLLTLADRDASIEKWLVEEVVPTIEAMEKDPTRIHSIAETREELRLYMARTNNGTSPTS